VKIPPAMASGPVTAGVSTRYDTYAVWVCNLPFGYYTYVSLFSSVNSTNIFQRAWQYVFGSWNLTQAQADCALTCVPATAAEQAFINQTTIANEPRATVAPNGTYKSRAVFNETATGTLGAAAGNSRVAIGQHCYEGNRIPGTNFYSVQGDPDVDNPGQTLPIVYAVCNVSFTIGPN
jgi:hypothetical protein